MKLISDAQCYNFKNLYIMDTSKIINLLGEEGEFLLQHTCKTIDKSLIHTPSPSVIDDIWINSDRNIQTLNNSNGC